MNKPILNEYVDDSALDADVGHAILPLGKPVPNKFPRLTVSNRLAVIGEAPGADEVRSGEPFVGASGRFLSMLLSKAGIVRDGIFIGNVCQQRPPNNDITNFSRTGSEITVGLEHLALDLNAFNPNICLLLGKTALWAAKGVDDISNWRGSYFVGERGPFIGRKCIASFHPAACLRQYDWTPMLMFDIKKAWREAGSPGLALPERNLIVDQPVEWIIEQLKDIYARKPKIAIDIEGGVWGMSCISVAESATRAFIVPFEDMGGGSLWDEATETEVWRALVRVLADPAIPKVLQNSLYDRFVLQYTYDIVVRGVVDDTMLKHWELYCELEKSLGFQASLYTNEPYYKSDRKSNDRDTFWRYCCRDSAITYEINERLERMLDAQQKHHYQFNMLLLNPILYMENRGIKYDQEKATLRLAECDQHIFDLQHDLDEAAGFGVKSPISRADLLEQARSALCYKRDQDKPKKGNEANYAVIKTRLLDATHPLDKTFLGHFNVACKLSLNIKSHVFKSYVYETLKCPKQYHPQTGELTTNYEALLKIYKQTDLAPIRTAIELSSLRTRSQMLQIHADPDGRIRCGYNIVGTETGRLTCYTSPTGSGYNLQTIPDRDGLKPPGHPLRNGMRDLFTADDGCWLFQADLSGADGWTVAAHLARCGDTTLLEDYKAGIKPAKVLCYMLRHGPSSVQGRSREEIKALTAEVSKDSWDYFACKIGQHGTCYLMGPRKLANSIFIQSEGKVNLSEREASELQRLFSVRYRVKLWHDATARLLGKRAEIVSASGHKRRFFGRPQEILGQALAHEPQANTTYSTNLAVTRLWTDPDNVCEGRFRVEPLHQVHDALLGQFKKEDTTWALAKIHLWFNNEIIIAGQPIIIPFEGQYGESWGNLEYKIV
jgi:uracil-DNA glycosylase family 4